MKYCSPVLIASLVGFCSVAGAAEPGESPIRLPVTRDTWFSNVGKEGDGSNGASPRLKLKSIQELSLIDIDPAPLKGHVIKAASLHVHLSGPEILRRVTVGSFGAEWVEGDATGYAVKDGVSTYNHRVHPDIAWAYPGSNLNAVMLGLGGTIWGMADASVPDAGRWQTIAVDPAVVAARVAGISTGFILFDDTGSEWTRDGDEFTLRQFPNRFIDSKDSNRSSAPYLDVFRGEADAQPPPAPTDLQSETGDLPVGEARISWITPIDAGKAGVIGFFVEVNGKPARRYLIPVAKNPGQRVSMHLRDLSLGAGQEIAVAIKAVDGAGNVGPALAGQVKVSDEKLAPLPGENAEPFKNVGPLPKLGEAEIAIIDALDKVQPVTGKMVPPQEPGYLAANHLWNGKTIHLYAARNEIVSFQILVRGKIENLKAKLEFKAAKEKEYLPERGRFFSFHHVLSNAGPMPDPLIECDDEKSGLTVPNDDGSIPGQTSGSLLCEIWTTADPVEAGEKAGSLTLTAGGNTLVIPVALTIWDFALPDVLSFIPEMNCYDIPGKQADWMAYYRLAHANRTVLNRVPYHQGGSMSAGCAPKWDAKSQSLDWTEFDRNFGSLFDGAAFIGDGFRRQVPQEVFYLPLFENWPTPMEGNYNGDYWADRAFPESYQKNFVEVSRQFARHFNQMKWDNTLFQCFFNGKTNFKSAGWSRGTSPWLLDEPANFQDYWALKFFGDLFHQGVNLASPGNAKLVFRADVLRPEWQRDSLDQVLDYAVIGGGAFRQYNRMVIDRKQQFGQIAMPYGGSNDPANSNIQPAAWCLDSWMQGGDGVLPWQTIGEESSWEKADALSLFYPGQPAGLHEPAPSIRLKSYLRGEQDVEYLTILAMVEKQSRYTIARRLRELLNLTGQKHGTGFSGGEDAGVIDFAALRPQDLWAFRRRIGQILNNAHPKVEGKLVEFRTPRREPRIDQRVNAK